MPAINFDTLATPYTTPALTGTEGWTCTRVSPNHIEMGAVTTGLSGPGSHTGSAFVIWYPPSGSPSFFNSSIPSLITQNSLALFKSYSLSPATQVAAFTVNASFTGTGGISLQNDAPSTIGTMTVNGTVAGLATYGGDDLVAGKGVKIYVGGTLNLRDLPRQLVYGIDSSNNGTTNVANTTASAVYGTTILLGHQSVSGTSTCTLTSTGGEAFSFGDATTGSLRRTVGQTTGTMTFVLGGNNPGLNTMLYGTTVTGGRSLSLQKSDSGRWVLEGDNSALTSGVALQGGFLRAKNNVNALGSFAVTMSAGTTLEFESTSGTPTWANALSAVGTISNVGGSNTLSGVMTLSGNTTVTAAVGTTLTVSQAISVSTRTLTLAGAGTIRLLSNPSVTSGSISITATGPVDAATPMILATLAGAPLSSGATLRYTGATATTVTNVLVLPTTNLATTALDSSSATTAATTTYTNGDTNVGTSTSNFTLKLAGSNTGANKIQAKIVDGTTGVTSLVKEGAGTWLIAGGSTKIPTFTGTTAVNAGTLAASCEVYANLAFGKGAVTVAAGATIKPVTGTTQQGSAIYRGLTLSGTVGNPAVISIGGSVA